MKWQLRFIVCFVLIFAIMYFFVKETYPATSPTNSLQYFVEHLFQPHSNLKKYVFGFLPYWNLDDIQYIRPDDLSEINYFSLTVNSDGHLATVANGQADPGWNGWEQQSTKDFITKSQIMGAKVSITIAAQDNDTIESVLNSNTAQANLISDILTQVRQRKLDGVNIDFEYNGTPDMVYQQEFTYFSKKLETQLKEQNPNAVLTLSILPFSQQQTGLFDFPSLVPVYDRFIGMTYDYYSQNSSVAGPDAPMYGFKQGKYFYDVTSTYTDFLHYIPKNKMLMGIPYYGWEWAVENGSTIGSSTLTSDDPNSYAAIISYARYRSDSDIKQNQCQWEKDAQESWCWFTDKKTGIDHQIWPMDNRSIQIRFDYANNQQFSGVAIWTLGLDKNYPDLWNMIQNTF
jgi:spore germination protein YaaH